MSRNIDLLPPKKSSRKQSRGLYLTAISLVVLAVAAWLFYPATSSHEEVATAGIPASVIAQPTQVDESPVVITPEIRREIRTGIINPGDTLTSLLNDYFTKGEIFSLSRQCKKVFPVTGICTGQPYHLLVEDDTLREFVYEINKENKLVIRYEDEQFAIKKVAIEYDIEVEAITGIIDSSLFLTISQLDESPELAMRLFDIFAWDIDFHRDIRQGDSFKVLIEKRYRNGEFSSYGKLLAAQFTNQGESYSAIRFEDGKSPAAYYNARGKSLKKAFLKAPLSYTRISSGYTKRRYHPVLNVWRPHLAVDYAAPRGTPVKAVADGFVKQRSYDKNNGNKIRLRHTNNYETTYIHLSKFGKGIRKGKKVRQGQIIGYVGATGLATGPHLDFRIFKNGKPINPLKMVKTPSAPVSKAHRSEFLELADGLMARLENLSSTQMAEAKTKQEDSESPQKPL